MDKQTSLLHKVMTVMGTNVTKLSKRMRVINLQSFDHLSNPMVIRKLVKIVRKSTKHIFINVCGNPSFWTRPKTMTGTRMMKGAWTYCLKYCLSLFAVFCMRKVSYQNVNKISDDFFLCHAYFLISISSWDKCIFYVFLMTI